MTFFQSKKSLHFPALFLHQKGLQNLYVWKLCKDMQMIEKKKEPMQTPIYAIPTCKPNIFWDIQTNLGMVRVIHEMCIKLIEIFNKQKT